MDGVNSSHTSVSHVALCHGGKCGFLKGQGQETPSDDVSTTGPQEALGFTELKSPEIILFIILGSAACLLGEGIGQPLSPLSSLLNGFIVFAPHLEVLCRQNN